jgi:hypothetical protein
MRPLSCLAAVIGCLVFELTSVVLGADSPETIYKYYAKRSPEKGITKEEFKHYLRDYTLSPAVKTLYESGNAAVAKAVDQDTDDEAMLAFTRQSVDPAEPMPATSFKDYITAFPPRKTIMPPPRMPTPTTKPGMPTPKPTPSGILDRLTNSWLHDTSLHVTRSAPAPGILGGADPGPAQFNWTHSAGAADVFTIDAAASYTYELQSLRDKELLGYYPTAKIIPSFEAHTSTSVTATQDSLKAKLDFQFALNSKDENENDLFQLQALSIAPAYETDRVKATETYGADIFYTPLLKRVPGMTALYPLNFWHQQTPVTTPEEAMQIAYPGFTWSPSIGFEVGHATMGDVAVYGSDADYARFVAKLKLDIYLIPQFDLSLSYAGRVFLTGDNRAFSFFDVAPILYLGPSADVQDPKKIHFAIGLDFKDGETTPNFKHVDSLSAFIGIKF